MQKSVLITGAAGLLGSHLVMSLLRRGYSVTGVDNLSIGKLENLSEAEKFNNFEFLKMDVCNEEAFEKIEPHGCIVHFAAYKIEVPGLWGTDILEINSQGTMAMVRLASKWKARFIFASTSDVYGKSEKIPFSERDDLVLGPSNVSRWGYAASKLFDEHICFAWARRYELPVTIIRYFNTYGPRHDLSPLSGGPQALFFDALIRGEKMIIHGDGSQKRCFAYVDDSIEMTARCVENQNTIGEIINIGNPDTEISILDLAKLCYYVFSGKRDGAPLKFISHSEAYQTKNFQEITRRIPDIQKAIRLLNYKPVIGNETGLERTLEWQKSQPIYRKLQ